MPHQITCASALAGKMGKHENCIFHSNAVLVHCLNPTSCLISSIFLTRDSYSRCCMTPKSCNQCVQIGTVGGMVQDNEVESVAEVALCCMHKAPVRCLLGFLFRKVMQKH